MNYRRIIAGTLGAFAMALGATFATAGPAYAGRDVGSVVPQGTCSNVGDIGHHRADAYRCEYRPGESCPHWHWVWRPGVPKSGRTAWPVKPCHTCTHKPSTPPSAPPVVTPPVVRTSSTPPAVTVVHRRKPFVKPVTPSPVARAVSAPAQAPTGTQVAAPSLPITGVRVADVVYVGFVLVLLGLALRASCREPERVRVKK